jgi:hypothetical protein
MLDNRRAAEETVWERRAIMQHGPTKVSPEQDRAILA